MFTNQCSKCGEGFETKNPKRVICPNCLYPEGAMASPRPAAPQAPMANPGYGPQPQQRPFAQPQPGGFQQPAYGQHQQRPGGFQQPQQRPSGFQQQRPNFGYNQHQPQPGGFQQRPGGYGPPQQRPGGFAPRPGFPQQQRPGGFGPPQQRGNFGPPRAGFGQQRPGGFGPPRGPRPGGFGPPRGRPGFGPPRGGPKKLLVTRDQLVQIEGLYKQYLPLPNPDVHEVIGEQINLAPSKVFFGINLVREKMKLPKLEYPKRKLAVTPEQLMAIETLYEPYLPLPPIGIHKIISKQLRMDEWRVHVAIGLIRKNRNLNRWNEDREDLPLEMKQAQERAKLEKEQQEIIAAAQRAAALEAGEELPLSKTKAKAAAKAREAEEAALKAAAIDEAENGAEYAEADNDDETQQTLDIDGSTAEEEAPVKPKATRGRPPKSVSALKARPAADAVANADGETVVPVVRRRGRPPKSAVKAP